jgi:hypothetical protein
VKNASEDRTFSGRVTFQRKRLTRRHNSIHLALKVKIFFDNSTPATGPSMESSSQKPGLSTASHQQHRRKRGKKKPAHKRLQSKA